MVNIAPTKSPVALPPSTSKHLRTDHLVSDLKGRSVRGGAITITAQALKFSIQLGSTAILARLLTPSDFGLVAMVTAITGFVAMFKDAGLSVATIQKAEISQAQVSNLFWVNVLLSTLAMLTVAAISPAISWFYHETRLLNITLVLAGTLLFGGLAVQHQALLVRQMRFGTIALIDILSFSFGVTTALIMSLLGCSYWSLIGMTIMTSISSCTLIWLYSGWRPSMPARGSGVRAMLRFGGDLTGFSILNYFTRNADNIIVGYFLGSGPLGIYSRAYYLLMMPIQQFSGPIGSVMLPALSRLQNDPIAYKRAFLKAIGFLAFIGMPIVAFLFVVADEAVIFLLGPKWGGVGLIFRFLTPAALLGTINVAPGWLCTSLGRPRIQLKWALYSAPIIVGSFIIGSKWGLSGVASSFGISWSVMFIIFLMMACHESPVRFLTLCKQLLAPLFAAVLAGVATSMLKPPPSSSVNPLRVLAESGLIYLVFYVGICFFTKAGRFCIFTFWRDGFEMIFKRGKQQQ